MMRLSIITINYNNAEGLRKTFNSVTAQTYCDFEHIIVDGGSEDGSVEIIEAYASDMARMASGSVLMGSNGDFVVVDSQDPTLANGARPHEVTQPAASTQPSIKWISEKDKGIYDAMNKGIEIALGRRKVNSSNRSEYVEDKNKGIRMASGEYVLFLNSGDILAEPTILQQMVDCGLTADVCYFDAMFTDNGLPYISRTYPESLSLRFFLHDSLCHQAMLYRLDILSQIGGYDEQYKLVGDWALNVKLIVLEGCSVQHYPIVTTCYEIGGLSWTEEGRQRCEKEKKAFLQTNLPNRIIDDYHYWSSVESLDWYRRAVRIKSKLLHKILLWGIKLLNRLER